MSTILIFFFNIRTNRFVIEKNIRYTVLVDRKLLDHMYWVYLLVISIPIVPNLWVVCSQV